MKRNMKRLALVFLLLSVSSPVCSQSPDKMKRLSVQNASQHKIKDEIAGSQSNDGEYWFSRGYQFHQSDRYPQAIEAFAHSIDLGYRQATAMYNIACGFALLNDKENALTWLERALGLGFDRPDLLRGDSDLDPLRSDPRFQQIIARVSTSNADHKAAKDGRSKTQDRFEEAVSNFEQLNRESSQDGKQWYKVGSRLLGLRDFDRATVALMKAIDYLGYRNESAMYNLACAYALKGEKEAALEWLEKSVNAGFDNSDKFQDDPDIASLRSDARFKKIEKLSRALSLSQFAGGSPDSKQQWIPAIRHYESFLQREPGNGRAWFNLGYSLHYSGEFARAIEAHQQAIERGYRKPTAMYNIACSYSMMGNKDAAFEWLEKSVKAGFDLGDYVKGDRDLDNLRSDSRFNRFLKMADGQRKEKSEK